MNMTRSKDVVGKLMAFMRSNNGQVRRSRRELSSILDCSQANVTMSMKRLLSANIVFLSSGVVKSNTNPPTFAIKDEYQTGDSWRELLGNIHWPKKKSTKEKQLSKLASINDVLAILDQQLQTQQALMQNTKDRRKAVENLIAQKNTTENEISEIEKSLDLKKDELRLIEQSIRKTLLTVGKPCLVQTKNFHTEETQEPDECNPSEVTSFEEEMAHYSRVSRENAKKVQFTREGIVITSVDRSR